MCRVHESIRLSSSSYPFPTSFACPCGSLQPSVSAASTSLLRLLSCSLVHVFIIFPSSTSSLLGSSWRHHLSRLHPLNEGASRVSLPSKQSFTLPVPIYLSICLSVCLSVYLSYDTSSPSRPPSNCTFRSAVQEATNMFLSSGSCFGLDCADVQLIIQLRARQGPTHTHIYLSIND